MNMSLRKYLVFFQWLRRFWKHIKYINVSSATFSLVFYKYHIFHKTFATFTGVNFPDGHPPPVQLLRFVHCPATRRQHPAEDGHPPTGAAPFPPPASCMFFATLFLLTACSNFANRFFIICCDPESCNARTQATFTI